MKIALLNTSILTTYGEYSYQPLSLENAKLMVTTQGFDSFIGHEATAHVLSELLGVDVPVNRGLYLQQGAMKAIVFKLNGRLDSVRELTRDEIEEMGYTLGILYRIDGRDDDTGTSI